MKLGTHRNPFLMQRRGEPERLWVWISEASAWLDLETNEPRRAIDELTWVLNGARAGSPEFGASCYRVLSVEDLQLYSDMPWRTMTYDAIRPVGTSRAFYIWALRQGYDVFVRRGIAA